MCQSQSLLMTTQGDGSYDYSHFTDEGNEAQRGGGYRSKSSSLLAPKPVVLDVTTARLKSQALPLPMSSTVILSGTCFPACEQRFMKVKVSGKIRSKTLAATQLWAGVLPHVTPGLLTPVLMQGPA